MSPAGTLAVTRNLIDLERGSDELLLVNSFYMRPLYVARGKERVRRVLSAAAPGLTLEGLTSACPRDVDLIRMLRDHRILIDTAADKEGYDQSEIEAAAAPRRLDRMTAYLLLTESCNLGCIYCLNGAASYQKHGLSKMSLEVALRSITTCLEQLSPGGALEVAFFGGEPLLNWPLLKEVMRCCETELQPRYSDKKITYHLTSNLTVGPKDLVEQIKGRNFTVMSDIDGPADIHDRCRACAWRYACGGGCPVMNLARLRGAESRPRVVDYSRRITCDLSRALLADSLWGLADQARDAGPAPGES
jgi:uncharacterized protein